MDTSRDVGQDEAAGEDDVRIITRVLSEGDTNAFEVLVCRYERYVFSVVGRYVPREAVEELAHESFVEAFKSLSGYRKEAPFKYWLRGIAVRTCYGYWRKQKRNRVVVDADMSPSARTWCEGMLGKEAQQRHQSESRRADAREVLGYALQQLSPQDRMVVSLVHLEGYSTAEAAEYLGWTTANVKVRTFRTRKALRRIIERSSKERQDERKK